VTALRWLDRLATRLMWLAHAMILFSTGAVIYYAADREPPYRVISSESASGYAGEPLTIRAQVWRNPHKRCELRISRHVVDSIGAAWVVGEATVPDSMLAAIEKASPGVRLIAFDVPEGAASGPAVLVTERQYICNKVHALWPIRYTTEQPFTVLSR